jgi:hypothetical protein
MRSLFSDFEVDADEAALSRRGWTAPLLRACHEAVSGIRKVPCSLAAGQVTQLLRAGNAWSTAW